MSTVIIDTGCANLSSVRYAFERLKIKTVITDNHDEIISASRVILPGVGNMYPAMQALEKKGLIPVIKSLTQPVLGICLGMQMLTKFSNEQSANNSQTKCLEIIDTSIDLIKTSQPIPHMGWNKITVTSHPLFNGVKSGSFVYFVHSYKAPISPFTIASCSYGENFSAAIAHKNFMGVQFHPEKSADVGSLILQNFMEL